MKLFRLKAKTWCTSGARIGGGGEGEVFVLREHPDLVVKLYHQPSKMPHRELELMLANPPHDPMAGQGHCSIAWPVDIVAEAAGGAPSGFVMPYLRDMLPVYQVYNLRGRLDAKILLGYRYLCAMAANVASAVEALHAKGYVIGDVNERNVLVRANSWTSLVDVDSFQVFDPEAGHHLLCPVFTPPFTAPELQGRNVAAIVRTPEQDRFGLGVLVFHLLMEGFHPYRIKYLGAGEPPEIDQRIASGLYPYAPARNGSVAPPPLAVPYDVLPRDVRKLFERCFVDGHSTPAQRPAAREWREVLRRQLDGFKTCGQNRRHEYWGHATSCPWCERAGLLGLDPFPAAPPVRRPAPPRAPVPAPAPALPPPRPARPPFLRRPRTVAGVLLLAVLALAGWALTWQTSPAVPHAIAGFTRLDVNAQGYPEYRHEKTGLLFVLLPGGKFRMGSPETEASRGTDEGPVHEVELSPFLIAKHEVTQEVWVKVMGTSPSFFKGERHLPVEKVSWDDCKAFCDKTGLAFPTEAQWEYACRAGTQTPFSFGATITTDQVKYHGKYPQKTVPVGSLLANAFGLHEMHGNLWEWCFDVHDDQFYRKPEATKKDPRCEAGSVFRVLRGGSWGNYARGCRSALRTGDAASYRGYDAGFRPALSRLPPE